MKRTIILSILMAIVCIGFVSAAEDSESLTATLNLSSAITTSSVEVGVTQDPFTSGFTYNSVTPAPPSTEMTIESNGNASYSFKVWWKIYTVDPTAVTLTVKATKPLTKTDDTSKVIKTIASVEESNLKATGIDYNKKPTGALFSELQAIKTGEEITFKEASVGSTTGSAGFIPYTLSATKNDIAVVPIGTYESTIEISIVATK